MAFPSTETREMAANMEGEKKNQVTIRTIFIPYPAKQLGKGFVMGKV